MTLAAHPASYGGPAVQRWQSASAIVIGDVHGRISLLDRLLRQVTDRDVFFLGDLCDRGEDSRSVVQRVLDTGGRTVLGNHDL
jgi:serine/threonine protein phosphatase 1